MDFFVLSFVLPRAYAYAYAYAYVASENHAGFNFLLHYLGPII